MVSLQHVTHLQAQRLVHLSPDLMLQNSTWLHCGTRLQLCVLYGSLSTQHQLNGFMAETECVYRAVRTECLYMKQFNLSI